METTAMFMGFISMVYFHNFFQSVLHYHFGRDKVLSFLKMMYNASGFTCVIIGFLIYNMITNEERLSHVHIISKFIHMQSLAAFMLVLLKQYERKKFDMWMSIVLFMIRTGSHVAYIFSDDPTPGFTNLIKIDLLIDCYVLVRLSNQGKFPPLNIFTVALSWNMSTALVAFWYHMLNISDHYQIFTYATQIVLSYLVTADSEIIRGNLP